MNPLELLYRPGVVLDWVDGKLKLRFRKGALSAEEIQILQENKPLVGGWLLLKRLSQAAYSLHLERRSAGDGYYIIPRRQGSPDGDIKALFALYEAYHDSAVELLLDTCGLLKIAPEEWHIKAHENPHEPGLLPSHLAWTKFTQITTTQQNTARPGENR